MGRWLLSWAFPLLLLAVVFEAILPGARAESEIDRHLRDQYLHKSFILRGFQAGNSLHYDAAGVSREERSAGDWTTSGVVRIDDISISENRLLIRGGRVYLGWLEDGQLGEIHDVVDGGKSQKENRTVYIEAELGSGAGTDDAADAAFAHVFLTPQDDFVELVPDYWRRCVRAALGMVHETETATCQFSADFLAIPGVTARADADATADPEPAVAWESGHSPNFMHPPNGEKPPRGTYMPTAEYNDPARKAKFQGSVTLKVVVDDQGRPTHIRIIRPLGCGLDAQAVQSVENWKFAPAEKDGVPVAAGVAVQVSFHLY